jgi:hypothetical protein
MFIIIMFLAPNFVVSLIGQLCYKRNALMRGYRPSPGFARGATIEALRSIAIERLSPNAKPNGLAVVIVRLLISTGDAGNVGAANARRKPHLIQIVSLSSNYRKIYLNSGLERE